mmetsp:Transcript_16634/g.49753  ORF Transcript_16634/g.49753 Transcript_16634/m.49753 type:complete len:226 (-) Transcript_16634:160-837(-)
MHAFVHGIHQPFHAPPECLCVVCAAAEHMDMEHSPSRPTVYGWPVQAHRLPAARAMERPLIFAGRSPSGTVARTFAGMRLEAAGGPLSTPGPLSILSWCSQQPPHLAPHPPRTTDRVPHSWPEGTGLGAGLDQAYSFRPESFALTFHGGPLLLTRGGLGAGAAACGLEGSGGGVAANGCAPLVSRAAGWSGDALPAAPPAPPASGANAAPGGSAYADSPVSRFQK